MKKAILFLAVILITSGSVFAQKRATLSAKPTPGAKTTVPSKAVVSPPTEAGDDIKFKADEHNFGTIPEGPAVSYDFVFTNNSKQPVQLESVRASCGCTTPNWSKDPVLPGKSSKITATYNTKGRPGNFYKTITVKTTAGQKILKIKGNVEKAPTSSVPTNNNSMIKH